MLLNMKKVYTNESQQPFPYNKDARYNAGRLFCVSLFSSIAINSVFLPQLPTLLKNIADTIQLVPIPPRFHNRKYKRMLRTFLKEQSLLCVGLYRNTRSLCKTLGATTSIGQMNHGYALVSPPGNTLVR